MSETIFDVELTVTKTVRVRVPSSVLNDGGSPEEAAEEFAQGGKAAWPDYVISEDEDCDVDSVTLVSA